MKKAWRWLMSKTLCKFPGHRFSHSGDDIVMTQDGVMLARFTIHRCRCGETERIPVELA